MAIYHCSVKTTSRSDGLSSVARAAYRSAEVLKDDRTGLIYDYSKKSGVAYKEIFLPDSPGIFSNVQTRSDLWNLAEQTENRTNSTVAREFEISLPEEFSLDLQIALAQDFSKQLINKFDFAADLSIHIPEKRRPDSDLEHENAHGHLFCFTRDSNGKKTRALDEKKSGAIEEVRKLWEVVCNKHLEKNGFDIKISCEKLPFKTLEERKEHNVGLLEKTERAIRAIENAIERASKNNDQLGAIQSITSELTQDNDANNRCYSHQGHSEHFSRNAERNAGNSTHGSSKNPFRNEGKNLEADQRSESISRLGEQSLYRKINSEAKSGHIRSDTESSGFRRNCDLFEKTIAKLQAKLKHLQTIKTIEALEEKTHDSERETRSPKAEAATKTRISESRSKTHSHARSQKSAERKIRAPGRPGPRL